MKKLDDTRIITLTINPAIDVHISLDSLSVGSDHLGRVTARDLGGKGVNVSRALSSLGVESACLLSLGRENGAEFASGLVKQGLNVEYILVDGAVRENLNIHSTEGDTVIATAGPILSPSDILHVKQMLLSKINGPTILVFSGRIAAGTDKESVIEMLLSARERGAELILDSRSLNKEDIIRLSPLMIKPNLDEARVLLGSEINDPIKAAAELLTLGTKYVLLTLGKKGLVLANGEDVAVQSALDIKAVSTVGAGDSTVASFIYSYLCGLDLGGAARHAVATSAAACMTEGTLPPDPCQIKALLDKIKNTSQRREV